MDTSYEACARIVSQAIRKIPGQRIGILDADDLRQELLPHALRGAERSDEREGVGYVYTCVANAVASLYASTLTAKRYPHDRYGQPVAFVNPDVLAWQVDPSPDPESKLIEEEAAVKSLIAARAKLDRLVATLPRQDSAFIYRCARDGMSLGKEYAAHIQYLLGKEKKHDE